MAYKKRRKGLDFDGPAFIPLPIWVVDCEAWARLSPTARALFIEFIRQWGHGFNGRLLATTRRLRPRGWNSSDVITRAKRELLESGFIVETVKGGRPNRASWYAVTCFPLDPNPHYDAGVEAHFKRCAYRPEKNRQLQKKTTREELYARHRNAAPAGGVGDTPVAPANGVDPAAAEPSRGAVVACANVPAIPADGDLLEVNHMPEAAH